MLHAKSAAQMEQKFLNIEIDGDAKQRDIELQRLQISQNQVEVERTREERLKKADERQAENEELRMASQKLQSDLMLKILENFQRNT
jgi:hypothetical protein